jgi:hypothetical protein
MARNVDIAALVREVKHVHDTYPNWTLDNAFVHWFLQAFLVSDAEIAAQSVTGVSHDKGVDAVFIDDGLAKVFVLQGKLHQSATPPAEPRPHIISFSQLAKKLTGPKADFISYLSRIDPTVRQKLLPARDRLLKRNYELHLYYVTTGRCSAPQKSEAESEVRQANGRAAITILDRPDMLALLVDYLGGAAPPVPYLDLNVDATGVVGSGGVIHRTATEAGITSWVLTMSGRDVANAYTKAGDRIFARNIRGFLGDRGINEQMASTLRREPDNFLYFNNGVTIVCDTARMTSESSGAILRVTNPQIINGQQTTRILHANPARKASVLVRVIAIPRGKGRSQVDFESMVSSIVAATNWQNAILQSDLRANDSRQIALQRELAKVKYQYLRKRQSKREARRLLGNRHWFWIKKDELAQVVGACDLDPYYVRKGKEGLFKSPHYDEIFDSRPVREYLSMYWLGRIIKSASAGYPDRAYAKWHALHFLWRHAAPILRSKARSDEFRRLSERRRLPSAISRAANHVYVALLAFFRKRRGSGPTAVDVSNFFYSPHKHAEFERYWFGARNNHRTPTARLLKRFSAQLDQTMQT